MSPFSDSNRDFPQREQLGCKSASLLTPLRVSVHPQILSMQTQSRHGIFPTLHGDVSFCRSTSIYAKGGENPRQLATSPQVALPLSYIPKHSFSHCGEGRIRTCDLPVNSRSKTGLRHLDILFRRDKGIALSP